MKKLVVWKKANNDFYYRVVTGFFGKYEVGFQNSYGHEIVYVLDINQVFYKPKFRIKVIKRLIRFLQNIEKKF